MQSTLPNLRHLRAFCEVAEHRSITHAAAQVFLSQPAITQAVSKMERQLDTQLFERQSDGMYPTKAGNLYAERAGRALALIRHGCQEALRIGAESAGSRHTAIEQMLTATQLNALIAVAKARNFSLAARIAGTSQPSLLRSARDLESLLEITLFEKTSQGIELTRAAQALVQHVKLAFSEMAQANAEISALKGIDNGIIVIGSMPLARHGILPSTINALAAELPDVRVSIVASPYHELLHGLRHGEIDLLIGALRDPVPMEDVEQETLLQDPLSIVARSGHPLTGKQEISLSDLAAYPWAVPPHGTPTRDSFETLMEGMETTGGLVESSSIVLIISLLLESDRLTLISRQQIRREQAQGLVTTLPYDLSSTLRPIGLTTRRNWRPTSTQVRFIELLRKIAKRFAEIDPV